MKNKRMQSARSSPAPDITYVVSAYSRPVMLPVILWAIKGQTHQNFECFVTDNSTTPAVSKQHEDAVKSLHDPRFAYIPTAKKIKVNECYHSAEYALKGARGGWYCFPCDDTYLVPEFGARMLAKGISEGLDFVYCEDVVVGPDASGGSGYRVWTQSIGRTVKTSFIVRASSFPGFSKPNIPSPVAADYFFGHSMRQSGKRIGSVRETMVVHN